MLTENGDEMAGARADVLACARVSWAGAADVARLECRNLLYSLRTLKRIAYGELCSLRCPVAVSNHQCCVNWHGTKR